MLNFPIYTGSADNAVKKIDSDGNIVWTFTGHSDAPRSIAVDNSGNVYSGDFEKILKKIDLSGNEIWSFTDTS